ncbi:MAG: hypothetical protein RLZ04_2059 [Actinomycetota bacterium]|jgi:hypothetical protein
MHGRTFQRDDLLSIVVISYKNDRELPRTLYSLSPAFQKGVTADQYEVVIVDNGSPTPPRARKFAHLGLDLSVVVMDNPTHSPVPAINRGIEAAVGAGVCVFIDGARLASPGLVARLREGLLTHPRAVVGSKGRYLGPVPQRIGMRYGYDQKVEDAMLRRIDWKNNGYRLFEASVFDEPSGPRWLMQVGESNSITMSRTMWAELGGYDPAFVSRGGGYVNLDTWHRACHLPGAHPVILLGESTFHQFHGGVATNAPQKDVDHLHEEYKALRGHPYRRPKVPATYLGAFVHSPPAWEFDWKDGVNFIDLVDPKGPMAGMLSGMKRRGSAPVGRKARVVRGLRRSRVVRGVAKAMPAGVRRRLKSLARRVLR